ncbi:MAG: AtpZ/AtpI family protein [Myxococcota bacterium]
MDVPPPEASPSGPDDNPGEGALRDAKQRERDEQRAMYRTGMSFSYIGIEFGLALFVGWFIGTRLDAWLGTEPIMLVIWIGLGFASAVRDLVRLVRRAKRELEDDDEDTVGGDG